MLAFLSSSLSDSQSSIPLTSSNFVNHFIHYWYVCISIIMFVNTWPIYCSTLLTSTKNDILSSPTTIAYYQTLNLPICMYHLVLFIACYIDCNDRALHSRVLPTSTENDFPLSLMSNMLSNIQSFNMLSAGSINFPLVTIIISKFSMVYLI